MLWMSVAAGQLIGRQDGNNVVHAGNGPQRLGADFSLVADHADDRAIGAAAQMGPQSQRLDPLDDVVDLLVGDPRLQDNDHTSR